MTSPAFQTLEMLGHNASTYNRACLLTHFLFPAFISRFCSLIFNSFLFLCVCHDISINTAKEQKQEGHVCQWHAISQPILSTKSVGKMPRRLGNILLHIFKTDRTSKDRSIAAKKEKGKKKVKGKKGKKGKERKRKHKRKQKQKEEWRCAECVVSGCRI